jgi:hypothetical protein
MAPVELPLTFFSMVLLGVAVVSLRDRRLRVASRRVARLCPSRPERDGPRHDEHVARAVRTVDVAAELLPGVATCLAKSLVVRALLQRRGITAELRIGVCMEPSGLAAHAWVEVDGRPVNEAPGIADVFEPLQSPASAAVLSGIR